MANKPQDQSQPSYAAVRELRKQEQKSEKKPEKLEPKKTQTTDQ